MSGLRIGRLLTVLAAGILVAPAAQAELLEVDLNTPGDALVTRDTDTGLDWLDLTESTNLSFDQVEGDVGGFISDGWRHATAAEVCGLFAAVNAETISVSWICLPTLLFGLRGDRLPWHHVCGAQHFLRLWAL